MAYSQALAGRVRSLLGDGPEISERHMFGGVAFLLSGNMAVGVSREDLMVRVGADEYESALSRPGVRAFDMSGRPMRGWVLVGPEATGRDADLTEWVRAGVDFAGSLPPK